MDIPPLGPRGGGGLEGSPLTGAHSGGTGPAPRFKPGSKVLYCADGCSAPVRGTVAKVDRGAPPWISIICLLFLSKSPTVTEFCVIV